MDNLSSSLKKSRTGFEFLSVELFKSRLPAPGLALHLSFAPWLT